MQNLSTTTAILLTKFNGQILIPFSDAAEIAGIAPQTARNQLTKGTFPIPSIRNGGRRFIHIHDLAAFIDGLRNSVINKPKRGRPTKASKIEAAMRAQ